MSYLRYCWVNWLVHCWSNLSDSNIQVQLLRAVNTPSDVFPARDGATKSTILALWKEYILTFLWRQIICIGVSLFHCLYQISWTFRCCLSQRTTAESTGKVKTVYNYRLASLILNIILLLFITDVTDFFPILPLVSFLCVREQNIDT